MRQTLFHIPAEFFGVPTLGIGWALLLWVIVSFYFAWTTYRESSNTGEEGENGAMAALVSLAFFLLLGAVVLGFALPQLEDRATGVNLGLPVRGYGVSMFIAVCTGVGLAIFRGTRRGLDADRIIALAIWLFVFGILGARLFFLIQNREDFAGMNAIDALRQAINVAGGGLVVYGALIGALLAYTIFVLRHRLPPLFIADLLAPSMLIGLAIGRVGCLMNGCCYGAPCDYAWAVQFPTESPPYQRQLDRGLQAGVYLQPDTTGATVLYVDGDGPAAAAGVTPGVVLNTKDAKELVAASFPEAVSVVDQAGNTGATTFQWKAQMAPPRSLPTHPAQLYSALNALLLCGLILAISPFTRRDGALLAITLMVYPITRFLLEIVRVDEAAVNGLGWTISQTVSVFIFAVGAVLAIYIGRQPIGKMQARQFTSS